MYLLYFHFVPFQQYLHGGHYVKNGDNNTDQEEKPFNYDIARMDEALNATKHRKPIGLSRKEFREWMKSKAFKNAK